MLFDEIEKAHPEVFNVLLQVLDDGRLTDGHGRVVDFRNTVLIMTSNIGSTHIQEFLSDREHRPEHWNVMDTERALRDKVMEDMRELFKPEFLNRVDEIILFKPLTRELLRTIVDIQLGRMKKNLESQEISLILSERAKDNLAVLGYDPVYGARPLKRAIQREVLNPLATGLLDGTIKRGDSVEVDFIDGKAQFRRVIEAEIVK